MSIWIRAICTQSIGHLAVSDLRRATEQADFLTWAENQDLDEAEGAQAEKALRFEGPPGELGVAQLFYRDSRFIRIERWTGEAARVEILEMLEELEGSSDPAARRIRDILSRAVETVGFELKQSDAEGMGWPISWQTAMWLAERGDGLVDADGEWWDPRTYEIIWSQR
ncbi:MAG: hypothetical protein JXR96_30630 [Deltaproteobacteria bacterium]|nr:hypothetical protein [Deltaproteobacteria bacterium]